MENQELESNTLYLHNYLADLEPTPYIPSTKEKETPWYRRFENKRRNKRK